MSDFRFWRYWPADLRISYLLLLALALFTIGWSVFEYLVGPDRAIPWLTQTDYFTIPVTIHEFSRLVHTFQVQASGYLITEKFDAGAPVLSATVANLYLLLLAVAVVYFLTAITTLKRIPYAVGMLLFMLFAASLNADALGLIQSTRNYFLIGLIVAYGLLTYYFQAFGQHVKFTWRLLAIALLTVITAVSIFWLSGYDFYTTTLHLIGHSSAAVMIAGVLFVVLVSFDNIQALLWLNGQGTTPDQRAGAGRFLLVSLLYLLSLLFIFLAQIGYFQVDVSVITPFFLLVISFFTGLWGFKQRETIIHSFLPFRTAGAFIYLSLAIVAFLGASYAFGTFNDPVVEAFNDAVLFTHLAFGALYLVFLFVNFGPAIHKRLPVYRVVYNPQRIPFFTVYGAGTILLVILVMRTAAISINQGRAGYYNYLGDLYRTEGNDLLAERYYSEGHVYENNNVRSNLNLATIAREKNYTRTQVVFLQRTLAKRPQEKMYVQLANIHAANGHLFDAMFLVREGLKKFPESYRLNSNMALLFAKTDLTDSVDYYLTRAHNLSEDPLLKNNTLALLVQNGAFTKAQEYAEKNTTDYAPFRSNLALLQILSGKVAGAKKQAVDGEKLFDEGSFMLFYHQMLGNIQAADTTEINLLNNLLQVKKNEPYQENLQLLKAYIEHYHGSRTEARKILEQLTLSSPNEGYYFNLLGLWLMEENLPFAASEQFAKAKEAGYGPAFLNHSYALALSGQTAEANNEAVRVMTSGNPALIRDAMSLQQLLATPPNQIGTTTNDTLRACLLQLYQQHLPAEVKLGIVSQLQQPVLKAQEMARLTGQLIKQNRLEEAEGLLQQLQEHNLAQTLQAGEINRLQASLLLAQEQYKPLLSSLPATNFGFGYQTLGNYYKAVSSWKTGNTKQAARLFAVIPEQLPFYADAVIATTQFHAQQQKDPMKAYEILLSALAYNPYSPELLKAYILFAVDLNLYQYAESSLERLSELVTAEEYSIFKAQYDAAVVRKEETAETW